VTQKITSRSDCSARAAANGVANAIAAHKRKMIE
jgi:hypothetical protein